MKRRDLTVRDLMTTQLITIHADERIQEGRTDMENGLIRHLPVVDDGGRLVGVVSDRDLMRRGAKISDVMERNVVTTRPDAPAFEAAAIMLDNKISSVLVVDDDNHLVGMVTQTDYLEVAHRALLGLPLER
jgi:CBS domain-containing protein